MYAIAEITAHTRTVAVSVNAHQVILFGSYARETATRRSDIDLLFIVDTPLPFVQRGVDILLCLYHHFSGVAIDLLVYTPREWQAMKAARRNFARRIMREGRTLYERRESAP